MITGLPILAWAFDPWTYILLGIVALVLFGKRLPEVGRSLGRGIAEFKKGLHEVQDELSREEDQPRPKGRLHSPADDEEMSRTDEQYHDEPAERPERDTREPRRTAPRENDT